jgi:peptidoglycan hydrolase-like protein with peptidoglycan-binding domain
MMKLNIGLSVSLALFGISLHLMPASAAEPGTLDRNAMFELQFRLDQLGYDAGMPDGHAGPRTRGAAAAFADKTGMPSDLSTDLLEAARTAAVDIEGWSRPSGEVDLLVFTDEGTAQLVRVTGWGLIHKSRSELYFRGYDRDGRKLMAEHFDVSSMESTTDITIRPWTSFGYEIIFPTPPRGERLEIDQSATGPTIQDDGTVAVETSFFENAFLKKPDSIPWYWYRGTEEEADLRLAGEWTMRLGQKGHVLMSRTFSFHSPQ